MKSNLLKGIILISAAALSSCTTLSDLSKNKALGDDVYYTKAKAGVSNYYVPQYMEQPQTALVRNDDYYYYGDYESRIRRFSYASPFNYTDDYYADYDAYEPALYPDTTYQNYAPEEDYTYDPYYDDLGVYSAYDFGYGDYYGYDDFGYGIAFSTFSYNGGSRTSHRKDYAYSNNNNGAPVLVGAGGRSNRYRNNPFGVRLGRNNNSTAAASNNNGGRVLTRGGAISSNTPIFRGARPGGNNAVYPGRPGTNAANNQGNAVTNIAGTNRAIRPANQNPRTETVVQQPTIERSAPPQQSSSSSNNSGGGGSSRGGGGRPVRP